LDSFDDFFNFLSTGSFVHTEKDYAASIPAFDFLARDFKDCPSEKHATSTLGH
jgi:hypothetical protein